MKPTDANFEAHCQLASIHCEQVRLKVDQAVGSGGVDGYSVHT